MIEINRKIGDSTYRTTIDIKPVKHTRFQQIIRIALKTATASACAMALYLGLGTSPDSMQSTGGAFLWLCKAYLIGLWVGFLAGVVLSLRRWST